MMTVSIYDVERTLGDYARCAQCGKKPRRLTIERTDLGMVRAVAICHGPETGKDINYEVRDFPEHEIEQAFRGRGEMPDMVFFRRTFAEYHRPTLRELLEARRT